MGVAREPLPVLVVGWFPRADDQIAGRFVADQVAALQATDRVRPTVVSFDPLPLHGDLPLRTRSADAWTGIVRTATLDGLATLPQAAFGPADVPVARIGVPVGRTAALGRVNEHDHRAAVLEAFMAGQPGTPWSLVHAHVGYPEGAGAARVARARGLPFVLTEHATYLDRLFGDPTTRAAYLEAARSADRIVAVGRVLADRIGKEFPELASRILVIPNTVDLASFSPTGPAGRDPDELLWVGYRREVKGMPTLLRAFRLVRARRPTTRLRLIGRSTSDEEEAGWRRLAVELGVADAARFEPPADRPTIAAAMERAALFVHPSRRETMGVVAVEALASGLPVVAADSGGVTEVLGPDPSAVGALVPPDDADALAAAILAALERRASFDPAVLRAHVARYGAAEVAGRIANLYDEILADRTAAKARLPVEAAAIDRPAAGGSALLAPDVPVVLVSFDRPALDRYLASAPAWASAGATIVTAGPPLPERPSAVIVAGEDAAAAAELLRSEARARGAGLAGLLAAGPRLIARRWRRRRLERRVLPCLARSVAAAVDAATIGAPATRAVLVCAGGIDVLAARAARLDGRARIAGGGLRWLGDLAWERLAGTERAVPQATGDEGADDAASES